MKLEGTQLRIMAENLLTTGLVTMSTSKVKTGYQVKDMTSYNRNIHFAFAGTFVIDDSNDHITLNGSFYTIAQGVYKRDELIAVINALINPDDIILSWEAGGYFKLSSVNDFDFYTDSPDGILQTLGFTDSFDFLNVKEAVAVSSRFHFPCEWIEVDFGYTPNMGFFGMVSSSLKEFCLSQNAKIKFKASQVNNFDIPAYEGFATITKEGAFKFFTDDEYDFRFWRIEIEDNENNQDVEFGYVYLGEAHTFDDRYNDQKAITSYNDLSEFSITENGSIIGFERQTQREHGPIIFRMVKPETRHYFFDVWNRFKMIRPFFVSVDPEAEITQEIYELTFLCSFKSKPTALHYAGTRWDLTMEVQEWL